MAEKNRYVQLIEATFHEAYQPGALELASLGD